MLNLAYYKVFVFSLFKSLHLNNTVHALDVQAAVDECKEALIEIDITNFIQVIICYLFYYYTQLIVQLSCVVLVNRLLVFNALNYMDSSIVLVEIVGYYCGYCSVSYSCVLSSIH